MSKKYKLAVVIGRRQISHKGHELLTKHALEIAERVLLIFGSAFKCRDPSNPFTWQERAEMATSILTNDELRRTICLPSRDYYNDEKWVDDIKGMVRCFERVPNNIVLVGHKKSGDNDTYYLDNFSEWALDCIESNVNTSSTILREQYFNAIKTKLVGVLDQMVRDGNISAPVSDFLKQWSRIHSQEYREIAIYHKMLSNKEVILDNRPNNIRYQLLGVITRSDHILLEKRIGYCDGSFGIPSTPIIEHESCINTVITMLNYGLGINVSRDTWLKYYNGVKIYDHPKRSAIGRVIALVHNFDFSNVNIPMNLSDESKPIFVHANKLRSIEDQIFEDNFIIAAEILDLHL